MRSSRRRKFQKKPYRHPRINKKNYKKSKSRWGWNDNVSGLRLNDINEVIRGNKAQRAEGKGSWKVVPKDSCEVYKERRKRVESNRRKYENDENTSEDESQMEVDKKEKKKPRKKNQKKKVPLRKYHSKNKDRKRSDVSSHSYTNTTSSVSTSHSTISEMECQC